MPTVTMNGKTCEVRTHRDLGQNWAVCVVTGVDDVSLLPRDAVPVMVKVHARSRWSAEECALKSLKDRGVITDFVLDPKPADEDAGGEEEAGE